MSSRDDNVTRIFLGILGMAREMQGARRRHNGAVEAGYVGFRFGSDGAA